MYVGPEEQGFCIWGVKKLNFRKVKRDRVFAVLLFAGALLSGCRSNVSDSGSSSTSSATVATRQVTDDLARTVVVPVKITRVVSLAPNLTENIFAVGAGDRLVGVTTFCNYPEEAKLIAKIGDTMNPNMESIVALKPEVVFVSTASQIETFMKTLEENGIAVYVTNPTSLDEAFKNLEDLAELFGTKEDLEISGSIRDVKRRRESLGHIVGNLRVDNAEARVFVQISREPLFTIGKESFLTPIVAEAGGYSVTENIATAYPKVSKETASALNPEVIILSDSDDNKEPNDAFKNSPAVKNGRIYKVNADLLSRPGPRLVDALEQIARDLHPEKFPNK